MDPIFFFFFFDSARKRVKCVIRQLENPKETLENLLYTYLKCWSNNSFSVAKQVRSTDEGTSVFNEYCDCHNKWRDG